MGRGSGRVNVRHEGEQKSVCGREDDWGFVGVGYKIDKTLLAE